MAKYRKKPIIIEAVRVQEYYSKELHRLLDGHGVLKLETGRTLLKSVEIPTLEGMMTARPGDYLIRGVQGELYPCKPDIFEKTYERVEE